MEKSAEGAWTTYHWKEVLQAEPQVDVIVRGEGEVTVVKLLAALEQGTPLLNVRGIAFMRLGLPFATPDAEMITDLDACRVGWELIDFNRYHYWGKKRAVVMQFSRGCPHLCSYCGQRGFWTRWRHRSPKAFAKEIAWLHREHGVEIINLADENPTSQRKAWKELCEALIEEDVDVELVGSTRAGDIVRDADLLHLYKKAGVSRFLLGTESTDEETLAKIKKGSTTAVDMEAIRLLREHDILSLATWVVGFEEERASDYWRGFRQLLTADPGSMSGPIGCSGKSAPRTALLSRRCGARARWRRNFHLFGPSPRPSPRCAGRGRQGSLRRLARLCARLCPHAARRSSPG
jgi:anaerobic magnesium-protoporphyrin IX monomethyl ester cyclase